jgi:hypothetical protein
MINEKQAKILLSECEQWLGTDLSELRKKLRNNHERTKSALWELIVLHATASFIISKYDENPNRNQIIASSIQHEPTPASPDIILQPDDCQAFYIEVAYIEPRNQQQEEEVNDFPRWVREKLVERGIKYANSLRIRLNPADSSKDIQVPPREHWKRQLKTDGWKTFLTELSSQKLPATWILEESNVIVEAEGVEESSFVSSSFPAQNIPEKSEDNPIYETIKRKAEQAKQTWKGKYGSKEPLVLVIGASESLHQIRGDMLSSTQLQKAVYSALADTDKWDWTTILNLTDNRSWPWAMRRQRVSGSGFISAVVIVTIRNEYWEPGYGLQKKAKGLIIKNPHPTVPLTAEQERFLEQINFNQIKYGHGREKWEQLPKNQTNPTPSLNKHLRESEGRFFYCPGEDSAFYVEIPCELFARFLVGDITADEVWDNHRLNIKSDTPSNPSLEEKIGSDLRAAANIRQPIVNVEFIQGNSQLREESRIRLEFGTFADSCKNGKDCLKDSVDSDTTGAFSVTLSTSLITCLLAGKTTAEEAWKGEKRQEIGDFLREAVNKGQEIVDSILVQGVSVPGCEPQITFRFGVAMNTSIREDKKVLREIKKQKKQKKSS